MLPIAFLVLVYGMFLPSGRLISCCVRVVLARVQDSLVYGSRSGVLGSLGPTRQRLPICSCAAAAAQKLLGKTYAFFLKFLPSFCQVFAKFLKIF